MDKDLRPRYFDNQITAFEDAKVAGGREKNKNNKKLKKSIFFKFKIC